MIKKILFIGLLSQVFGFVSASEVQEISAIENSTTIAADDMYLINYYQDILKGISSVCETKDIAVATGLVQGLVGTLSKKYSSLSIGEQLNETVALHDKLLGFQGRINALGGEHYCVLKYVLYYMQDRLRDRHVDLMEQTGIIKDFDGFVLGGAVHGAKIKLDLLDGYIAELKPYESQLGVEIQFGEGIKLISDSQDWFMVGEKSKELMELSVYKAMVQLKKSGLFTDDDIAELSGKFILNMHLSCNAFHGNYKVLETIDHQGNHVTFDTQEVPLDVNACGNYFLLQELPLHFYKIVIHELAHHFYYYHDFVGKDAFESICWSGNSCSQNDFVSDYARTSAIEDYAEHFMHRFLGLDAGNTAKISAKNAHFDKFLP